MPSTYMGQVYAPAISVIYANDKLVRMTQPSAKRLDHVALRTDLSMSKQWAPPFFLHSGG